MAKARDNNARFGSILIGGYSEKDLAEITDCNTWVTIASVYADFKTDSQLKFEQGQAEWNAKMEQQRAHFARQGTESARYWESLRRQQAARREERRRSLYSLDAEPSEDLYPDLLKRYGRMTDEAGYRGFTLNDPNEAANFLRDIETGRFAAPLEGASDEPGLVPLDEWPPSTANPPRASPIPPMAQPEETAAAEAEANRRTAARNAQLIESVIGPRPHNEADSLAAVSRSTSSSDLIRRTLGGAEDGAERADAPIDLGHVSRSEPASESRIDLDRVANLGVDPLDLSRVAAALPRTTAEWITSDAKSLEGNDRYAGDKELSHFGITYPGGSNKCNLFVHDVLFSAGVKPPTKVRLSVTNGQAQVSPLLAGEWADVDQTIDGFTIESSPTIGDVVAASNPHYSDASGHVAIVVGVTNGPDGMPQVLVASVSSKTGKVVVKSLDDSFPSVLGYSKPVYRRVK